MFSGITQGLFPVHALSKHNGLQYTIMFNEALVKDLKIGASVAIDGVCQTVVDIDRCRVTFDAIPETLSKTTLDTLFVGRKVSVERSLRFGDEVGGHEISGHVFERATITAKTRHLNGVQLLIQCSAACFAFIRYKGFVAVDGSSLTVGALHKAQRSFEVHLIPETLRITNFAHREVGSCVNLEPDAKTMLLLTAVQDYLSGLNISDDPTLE